MLFARAYRPIALQMRLPRRHKRHSKVRSPATATTSARSRMSTLLKSSSCKLETRRPMLTAWLCPQPLRWRWRPALLAALRDRIQTRRTNSLIPVQCRQSAYRRINHLVSQAEHAMSVGEPGDWKFAEIDPVVVASPGKGG